MMKAQELRTLSEGEIAKKIHEMQEELFNLRFQAKMGQLADALQLRMVKRTIARASTVLAEKARERPAPDTSAREKPASRTPARGKTAAGEGTREKKPASKKPAREKSTRRK
jgi:large subunit ribosomal protein L29